MVYFYPTTDLLVGGAPVVPMGKAQAVGLAKEVPKTPNPFRALLAHEGPHVHDNDKLSS